MLVSSPVRKLSFCGLRLTKALAGATTFAAMLVLSVATARPNRPRSVGPAPPIFESTATGSAMGAPKITAVADVTTRARKEKRNIVSGRPIACPASWDFWEYA